MLGLVCLQCSHFRPLFCLSVLGRRRYIIVFMTPRGARAYRCFLQAPMCSQCRAFGSFHIPAIPLLWLDWMTTWTRLFPNNLLWTVPISLQGGEVMEPAAAHPPFSLFPIYIVDTFTFLSYPMVQKCRQVSVQTDVTISQRASVCGNGLLPRNTLHSLTFGVVRFCHFTPILNDTHKQWFRYDDANTQRLRLTTRAGWSHGIRYLLERWLNG